MEKQRTQFEINLLDTLLLYIVLVSMSSVALLSLGVFKSIYAIILGGILFALSIRALQVRIESEIPQMTLGLLVILLLAVLFRSDPYLTPLGGSDEGIYVNMSTKFEKSGSPIIVDEVRESLNNEEKQYYDTVNNAPLKYVVKGKYEGNHLPGIDIVNHEKSQYVFQFYPLHPLWMSITARIFGDGNRVYSLVFFSMISIYVFYLLAFHISGGNRHAAYVVALLLAVNPLHALFSKFPTTEVMVLAFSSSSFYYLIKFYEESLQSRIRPFYITISAGLAFCLFFTHLRGFIYLPFFYLLFLLTIVFLDNRIMKKYLLWYFFLIVILFGMSLMYGYIYDYPYFTVMFDALLKTNEQNAGIKICFLIASLAFIAIFLSRIKHHIVSRSMRIREHFPLILLIPIFIGLISAYLLGFTHYLDGQGYLGIANRGWQSVHLSSISYIIHYLSPIGFILLLGILFKTKQEISLTYIGLILFLFIIWSLIIVSYPGLPDYIRARYLLAELVPYTLLLLSLSVYDVSNRRPFARSVAFVAVLLIAFYSAYYSIYQLQGKIKDADEMHLARVGNIVTKDDVVLLNAFNPTIRKFIQTPLEYYLGLKIIPSANFYSTLERMPQFMGSADTNEIYLLSQKKETDQNLRLIDSFIFRVATFNGDIMPESRNYLIDTRLYLYRFDKDNLSNVTKLIVNSLGWTTGKTVVNDLNYSITSNDKYVVLKTMNSHPFRDDLEKLKLQISINKLPLTFHGKSGNKYYFRLPIRIKKISEIQIESATFIPKELGINNDTRSLGIDVASVMITSGASI